MSNELGLVVQFLRFQATEVSKHQKLRVQVSLDGNVQESQESILDDGVHKWQEPFSYYANFNSRCEIHILMKKKGFLCWAGGYKNICQTRRWSVGDLFDVRRNGVVKLPLFDSRADKTGAILGNITFSIVDRPLAKDWSSTRGKYSPMVSGTVHSSHSSLSEKPESQGRVLLSPHLEAPTPQPQPSPLASRCPSYIPPQPPSIGVPSSDVLTPQHVVIPPYPSTPESHYQLPQLATVSPKESGADQSPTGIEVIGHASGENDDVLLSVASAIKESTRPALLKHEEEGLPPTSEITNFTGILCEPHENPGPSISVTPYLVAEPQATEPIVPHSSEPAAFSQINIIISSSSRNGSPLSAPSESSSIRRSNPMSGLLHVNTEAGSQGLRADYASTSGQIGQSSPIASSHPTASTTNASGVSGLSPFSGNSLLDSPQTAATSPSLRSIDLSSPPVKRSRQRPTIDTSCVGPRGQVRKHTVPPVTQPTKLRNASLDLSRYEQSEAFEYNPSVYSVAPSISSRNFRTTGERCPSTHRPVGGQSFTSSPRAPSIRREQLEYDDTQICLDTANLGDQEVAAFLREIDAALSAVTNRSAAVPSDGHTFLSVPSTGRGLSSRQSRWPSSRHLRTDFLGSRHSRDDWEGVSRSANASENRSTHSDDIPSRYTTPLDQIDSLPTLISHESNPSDLKSRCSTFDANSSRGPLIFIEDSGGKDAARLLSGSWYDGQPQGIARVPSISVSVPDHKTIHLTFWRCKR